MTSCCKYRIYIVDDDQVLEPFVASSDDAAFQYMKTLAVCFDDDLDNYQLFKVLEV